MSNQIEGFGKIAAILSRGPLGIIALLLVYGFASLVFVFAEDFTTAERLPLVYFLIFFPILVLAVFAWLVSKYPHNLFGPGAFEDQHLFIEWQKLVLKTANVASAVGAAQAKRFEKVAIDADIRKIADLVRETDLARPEPSAPWRNQILWVDDWPKNNTYEQKAFEAMGLHFTSASSTNEAFERLSQNRYGAIISDMDRREGPREGYVLLDRLREEGDHTPLFFYTSSNAPEHKQETLEHGGQGSTNDPQELFEMVIKACIESRAR